MGWGGWGLEIIHLLKNQLILSKHKSRNRLPGSILGTKSLPPFPAPPPPSKNVHDIKIDEESVIIKKKILILLFNIITIILIITLSFVAFPS